MSSDSNKLTIDANVDGHHGNVGDDESLNPPLLPKMTNTTNDESPMSVSATENWVTPVRMIEWREPENFDVHYFFGEEHLKQIGYPKEGNLIESDKVFTCGWCRQVVHEGVHQFYCDSCHQDACIQCSPINSTCRCIGCSKTVCVQCNSRDNTCGRCRGYVCKDCFDWHNDATSDYHLCPTDCCIHVRARRYLKQKNILEETDESESETEYDSPDYLSDDNDGNSTKSYEFDDHHEVMTEDSDSE